MHFTQAKNIIICILNFIKVHFQRELPSAELNPISIIDYFSYILESSVSFNPGYEVDSFGFISHDLLYIVNIATCLTKVYSDCIHADLGTFS